MDKKNSVYENLYEERNFNIKKQNVDPAKYNPNTTGPGSAAYRVFSPCFWFLKHVLQLMTQSLAYEAPVEGSVHNSRMVSGEAGSRHNLRMNTIIMCTFFQPFFLTHLWRVFMELRFFEENTGSMKIIFIFKWSL